MTLVLWDLADSPWVVPSHASLLCRLLIESMYTHVCAAQLKILGPRALS